MYETFSIPSAPGQQGPPGTPPGRGIPPLGCPGPAGARGTQGAGPTVRNSRAGPLQGAECAVSFLSRTGFLPGFEFPRVGVIGNGFLPRRRPLPATLPAALPVAGRAPCRAPCRRRGSEGGGGFVQVGATSQNPGGPGYTNRKCLGCHWRGLAAEKNRPQAALLGHLNHLRLSCA